MANSHSSPRQTLSYLRNLFGAHGIRPKNKLGQSFLIDLNLLDVLIQAAELSREDLVVEIGSGTGGLTTRLADQAGAVLSVEIDPDFVPLARDAVAGRDNVVLLYADVLKNKNHLNPRMLAALAELRERSGCGVLKLVANMPYAVATPVLSNFLLSDFVFERMVVMVQSEIAERLMAVPGTKDYGSLAVLLQSLADVEVVRRVPPAVFWPRPQVASAIVMIRPNPTKRAHVGDVVRFRNFLRDLYTHRRKNLRSGLAAMPGGRSAKEEIDQKLNQLGVDGTTRAENLDIGQHLRLCQAFSSVDKPKGDVP
jgi:16S rRNA (adenine1518-N6/adenine1519-N6)-dimethyltransferase